MGGRSFIIIAVFSLIAGFIGLQLALQPLVAGVRIDVTEDRLHTLSDGTRQALSDLTEPVDLTLYYSRQAGLGMPRLAAHARQIEVLLEGMVGASNGKLRLSRIDPEPFSIAEDAALAAGLIPVQTGDGPAWLGIEGQNVLGDRIVIPFLAPTREAGLEYELVRMITALDQPRAKKIAIISSLSTVLAGPGAPGRPRVLEDMARGAELTFVPRDFSVLPDADLLVLIHPWPLTERQEWLVDQFILDTGRALILVDPLALAPVDPTAGTLFATRAGPASSLGKLGAGWGIGLAGEVLLDLSEALPVEAAGPGGTVPQPLFFRIPAERFSDRNLITSGLERGLHVGAAGALAYRPDAIEAQGLRAEALITASEAAVAVRLAAADDLSPAALTDKARAAEARGTRPGMEAFTFGLMLEGPLRSAFEGPPPADSQGIARPTPAAPDRHKDMADGDVRLVILADTDLLDDGLYFDAVSGVTLADNAALIINAIDFLTGTETLASLRGRAPARRSMTQIEARRQAATDRYRAEQAALDAELVATQTQIDTLRRRSGQSALARFEAEGEIDRALQSATDRAIEIRSRLRGIEGEWQAEIKRLELKWAIANIFAMPILIGLLALGFALWRAARLGPGREGA